MAGKTRCATPTRYVTIATAPYRYGTRTRQARLCRFTSGRKAGRYFADYFTPPRDGHGGRHRPEIDADGDKAAAEAFHALIDTIPGEIDAMLGPADTIESGDPTIADLCLWYVRTIMPARGNCERTKTQNTRVFEKFCTWLSARGVETADGLGTRAHLVDEYVAELCGKKRPGTVRNEMSKIKAVFSVAMSRGRISRMPVREWPLPKKQPPIYDDLMRPGDFHRLIERLRSGTANANGTGAKGRSQIYGVVKFMSLQACRPCDACNLTWANVHLDDPGGPVAIVRQQKTGHPVAMALSIEAVALIEEERARKVSGVYVFTGRFGKRVNTEVIFTSLKWHCKKLNIPMIGPKRFRQYGVSILIASGADEMYVRSVTGHESASIRNYKRTVDGRSHALAEVISASLKKGGET